MAVRLGIRWGRIPKNPEYDLCGTTASGYWDIVNGIDGWVIYTPSRARFVNNGREWINSSGARGAVGAVTRDQAKTEAERMQSALVT